jgi:hypothetical protein
MVAKAHAPMPVLITAADGEPEAPAAKVAAARLAI